MKKYRSEGINREVIDITKRMAWMAEYHEENILKHFDRVRGYAAVLALGLGMNPLDAEVLSYACQLHDIGKIGLPDGLLMKTGDFTPFEWELLKRHTIIGAEILANLNSPIPSTGETIAFTHHERWDGSGYPNGTRGEAIPISGRICAIVDVFDALTTKRQYKQEIPLTDAFELMRESAGSLFDPQLVKIFLENADEIQRIRQANL